MITAAKANQDPSPEEQASYFEQDDAGHAFVDAMARIDQTCAHSRSYTADGWHEMIVIRTDHIGVIRRFVVRVMMNLIYALSRPVPETQIRLNQRASSHTTGTLAARLQSTEEPR